MAQKRGAEGMVVLGMHRSGTSCLAGSLALCGAHVGDADQLTNPSSENRKGFFELKAMRKFCDETLFAASSDWWNVSDFSIERIGHERKQHLMRLAKLAVGQIVDNPPWVVKEPRLCIVLPLLMRVIDPPAMIHMVRNPGEVAMSLRFRNGFTISHGLALWEAYNRSILKVAEGRKLHRVMFSDLQRSPTQCMSSLIAGLAEAGVSGLSMPAGSELEEFVDGGLRHESVSEDTLKEVASPSQLRLWRKLSGPGELTFEDLAPEPKSLRLALLDLAKYQSKVIRLTELEVERKQISEETVKREIDIEKLVLADQKMSDLADSLEVLSGQLKNELAARRESEDRALQQDRSIASEKEQLGIRLEVLESVWQTHRQEELDRIASLERSFEESERSKSRQLVELKDQLAGVSESLERFPSTIASFEQTTGKNFSLVTEAQHAMASELRGTVASQERIQIEQLALRASELEISNHRLEVESQLLITGIAHREASIKAAAASLATKNEKMESRIDELKVELSRLKRDGIRALREARVDTRDSEQAASRVSSIKAWRQSRRMARVIRRSELFDADWYSVRYTDVTAAKMDPAKHFLLYGGFEERHPGPEFDTRRYLDRYPDVETSGMNPLLHYILYGESEGRLISPVSV